MMCKNERKNKYICREMKVEHVSASLFLKKKSQKRNQWLRCVPITLFLRTIPSKIYFW